MSCVVSRRTVSAAAGWWLLCAVVSLLVRSTVQEEIYFKKQPEPYYYSYPSRITLIECGAVRIDNAGEETPIDATLYRGLERINPVFPPERHQAYQPAGVVAGVIVVPTEYEDAGVRYRCEVEGRGGEVVRTREAKLLVGEGLPFSVEGVVQLDQSLYSMALEWNAALVPSDSPILSYLINVTRDDEESPFTVEVEGNVTGTELSALEPATVYQVSVSGVNSHGEGTASAPETVLTLVPEVPRPPTGVMVEVDIGTTSTSIAVTWTPTAIDPEVMTPLMNYVIYYGTEDPLSFVELVPNGTVSGHTVYGITVGGNLSVGVAAQNSAGRSQVAYLSHSVAVGCGVLAVPEHGLASQTGLADGSTGSYSCGQGFSLSANQTRVCLSVGEWSGDQPTCNKVSSAPALSSQWTIIIISVAIATGLLLIVTVIVLIVCLRRKAVRLNRHEIASGGFPKGINASPPIKRQKIIGAANNTFDTANNQIALTIVPYSSEPRAFGTPPPPEATTFQTTPSSILPPSYSDLEDLANSANVSNGRGGFARHSNRTPPPENGAVESCLEESTDNVRASLTVQYSAEPRAVGHSPMPHSRGSRKKYSDSEGGSERGSDDNSTTNLDK